MRKFLTDRATVIGVSLAFFAFGFSLAANIYDLTFQETMIGLFAGAICGVTIMVIEFAQFMRARDPAHDSTAVEVRR